MSVWFLKIGLTDVKGALTKASAHYQIILFPKYGSRIDKESVGYEVDMLIL